MVRKNLKKVSKSEKLKSFIKKYKIPSQYLSTSRKMVSKAVFIGIFIAFIPMPMQMAAVLAMMPFFKFNVPIALAMCWFSNPFTMPPMYYMEYLTGNFLLGREGIDSVKLTMGWFRNHWDDIIVPLYTGAAFYSIVVSSIIYAIVNLLWIKSVKSEQEDKSKKRRLKRFKK